MPRVVPQVATDGVQPREAAEPRSGQAASRWRPEVAVDQCHPPVYGLGHRTIRRSSVRVPVKSEADAFYLAIGGAILLLVCLVLRAGGAPLVGVAVVAGVLLRAVVVGFL